VKSYARVPRNAKAVGYDVRRGCLPVTRADAVAIRAALLAWLDPTRTQGQLHRARELADLPIRDGLIGGYHLVATRFEADGNLTLMMTASQGWGGFRADVQPDGKGGWTATRVFWFHRQPVRR